MSVFLLLAIISCESYSLSLTCSLFCAMLCISTVFTVVRWVSVCPSVTLVHCIHTAEDIVKLISRLGL